MTRPAISIDELKARIVAQKAADASSVCVLADRCSCPTCGVAEALLRAKLLSRGFATDDTKRATVSATACGDGSYPFIASVRVDDREVYRIMREPSELFEADVMEDITNALRRAK